MAHVRRSCCGLIRQYERYGRCVRCVWARTDGRREGGGPAMKLGSSSSSSSVRGRDGARACFIAQRQRRGQGGVRQAAVGQVASHKKRGPARDSAGWRADGARGSARERHGAPGSARESQGEPGRRPAQCAGVLAAAASRWLARRLPSAAWHVQRPMQISVIATPRPLRHPHCSLTSSPPRPQTADCCCCCCCCHHKCLHVHRPRLLELS